MDKESLAPVPNNDKRKFIERYEAFLKDAQVFFLSPTRHVGPVIVALMPASFTALSVFHQFRSQGEIWIIAAGIAFIVAGAMEVVSINSIHTASDLFLETRYGRAWFMTILAIINMLILTLVIGFAGDAFSPLVRNLGMAAPWLTGIVYLAVSFARQIEQDKATEQAEIGKQSQAETDDRRQKYVAESRRMEMEHAERLAKIEANKQAKIAKASVPKSVQKSVQSNGSVNVQLDTIYEMFNDNPQTKIAEIARTLNISRGTVYKRIEHLNEQNRLSKNGVGYVVNGDTK